MVESPAIAVKGMLMGVKHQPGQRILELDSTWNHIFLYVTDNVLTFGIIGLRDYLLKKGLIKACSQKIFLKTG